MCLFDRSRQPILPTPEGVPILEQAKEILSQVRKLDFLCRNRKEEVQGDLHLAVIPTVAPYLLPRLISPMARAYPKIELSIQEMTTDQLIEELENDRLDVGVLATPLGISSLVEVPLYYEPFYLMLPTGHRLAKKMRVAVKDLEGEKLWLLGEGHCFRNQVIKLCDTRKNVGVFTNIHFESGNFETLLSLVRQGEGATLLPALALPKDLRGLHQVSFYKPVPAREISLVYRRTQYKQALIMALRQRIEKIVPPDLSRQKGKELQILSV